MTKATTLPRYRVGCMFGIGRACASYADVVMLDNREARPTPRYLCERHYWVLYPDRPRVAHGAVEVA